MTKKARCRPGGQYQANRSEKSSQLIVERSITMGKKLESLLCKELGSHPLVGDITGRGLFWAVEFVLGKDLKTSFQLKAKSSSQVVKNSLDLGLNILGNLGHTGKYQVDHVLVCPPYTVTDNELQEIISLRELAIDNTSRPFLS